MSQVVIYSLSYCPYCVQAKALLHARGIAFEETIVDPEDHEVREKLRVRSGMKTFPQIFCGETLIGGFTDLRDLDESQGLDHLKG